MVSEQISIVISVFRYLTYKLNHNDALWFPLNILYHHDDNTSRVSVKKTLCNHGHAPIGQYNTSERKHFQMFFFSPPSSSGHCFWTKRESKYRNVL